MSQLRVHQKPSSRRHITPRAPSPRLMGQLRGPQKASSQTKCTSTIAAVLIRALLGQRTSSIRGLPEDEVARPEAGRSVRGCLIGLIYKLRRSKVLICFKRLHAITLRFSIIIFSASVKSWEMSPAKSPLYQTHLPHPTLTPPKSEDLSSS